VPVIKVATRSILRSAGTTDGRECGTIATGETRLKKWAGNCSNSCSTGQRPEKTWAEQWRLHNALVLFNPAPVT
jgi:galactarate dehydratase